jgi:hypothetical protein
MPAPMNKPIAVPIGARIIFPINPPETPITKSEGDEAAEDGRDLIADDRKDQGVDEISLAQNATVEIHRLQYNTPHGAYEALYRVLVAELRTGNDTRSPWRGGAPGLSRRATRISRAAGPRVEVHASPLS